MKQTITYNELYVIMAMLGDLAAVKLPTKAMTERLLMRSHYLAPMREFEAAKQAIGQDETADDEAKTKAAEAKAAETIEGFVPRRFTEAAFEEIVGAMVASAGDDGMIVSAFATTVNDKGEQVQGKLPVDLWLQNFADLLVG